MKALKFLFAATAAALTTPTTAQVRPPLPETSRGDLQCFIIYSSVLGTTKDEKIRSAATNGFIYFLGKLDGGAKGIDMFEEVKGEALKMQKVEFDKVASSCDLQLNKRGQEVQAIGAALAKAGI